MVWGFWGSSLRLFDSSSLKFEILIKIRDFEAKSKILQIWPQV